MGCTASTPVNDFNNNNNSTDSNSKEDSFTSNSSKSRSRSKLFSNNQVDGEIHEVDVHKTFSIKKALGSGSYGEVKLVKHNITKQYYAMKQLDKKKHPKEVEYFLDEVSIMKKLGQHPNIVQVHYVQETKTHLYTVMDYVSGHNLLERALRQAVVPERDCANIVRHIAQGLSHMHKHSVVHRDLKLENILCVNDDKITPVKIADFGLAKEERYFDKKANRALRRILKSACGSPLYVAPEIVNRQSYSTPVDIWGLGVITYSLLCGKNPFYSSGITNKNLYRRIRKGQYAFNGPRWKTISRQAKKFICRLLIVDPKRRLTADQILLHPWVVGEIAGRNSTSTSNSGDTTPTKHKRTRTSTSTDSLAVRRLNASQLRSSTRHNRARLHRHVSSYEKSMKQIALEDHRTDRSAPDLGKISNFRQRSDSSGSATPSNPSSFKSFNSFNNLLRTNSGISYGRRFSTPSDFR